ncbi:MAG TPA: hypothetical protein VJT82_08295, partial [Pyrinomonadaceae bacterium]|nr:hypothetical protein [Pyrinomonadaceae bacterium]
MKSTLRGVSVSRRRACQILPLALLLVFSACGKRRPPQPPTENVPQRTEFLSGVQRGNQVIL